MKKLLGIAPVFVLALSCAPATSGIGGGDDDNDNDNNGSEGEGEGEGEEGGEEGEGEPFACGDVPDCDGDCINDECVEDGDDEECVDVEDDQCADNGQLCNDGVCDVAEAVTCPGLAPGDETVDPEVLLTDATFELDPDFPCDEGEGMFISAFVLRGSGNALESITRTTNFDFVIQANESSEELLAIGGCTTNSSGDVVGLLARTSTGASNYVCGEIE